MISVSKRSLTEDVQAGMNIEQLCEKYSTDTVAMTKGEMKRLLKEANLKLKRSKRSKFQLSDDVVSTTNESINQ